MKKLEHRPLVMIVGIGNLALHVLNMLLSTTDCDLVLAGRDIAEIKRRVNLARFAAYNLGKFNAPLVTELDLWDVDKSAETLRTTKPDIIFMAASLQSWRVITQLPKEIFEALDEAQFGPWLPMHLALNYNLMRAVKASAIEVKVVNSAFPDAVGPILAKVGLAPAIGIGNVANIVPALSLAAAAITNTPIEDIEVRLTAQHYFSHFVPRFGHAGNSRYHMSVKVGGRHRVGIDDAKLFQVLNGPLKRTGGVDGQLLTASSATRVIRGLLSEEQTFAHAPAPNGLPGGYPVKISAKEIITDFDGQLTLDEAIKINTECQRADGIEYIAEDGTVTFTEREMAIMRKLMGYSCRQMKLEDAADQAAELGEKYRRFSQQFYLKAA